ncbi:hypothetical protein [Bacillus sp. E(2018)]|uniref:hypothetical protein n=1 Tax=Bacillus sp. E(2018) TaxID=2502239 RepID=UPI0010F9CF42|nr:hypothetical protein [Bacillus sp. E(2018)]
MSRSQTSESSSLSNFIKEAGVSLSIITVLWYLLSFSYINGERKYYGIEKIAISNFNLEAMIGTGSKLVYVVGPPILIYFIVVGFIRLVPLLAFLLGYPIYLVRILYNKYKGRDIKHIKVLNEDDKNFPKSSFAFLLSSLLFILITLFTWLPLMLKSEMMDIFISASTSITFLLVGFLLFYIIALEFKKDLPLISLIHQRQNPLSALWRKMSQNNRILSSILVICLLPNIAGYLGGKLAEDETEFNLIYKENREYIILDQNKTTYLVAPLYKDNKKHVVYQNQYHIIDIASFKEKEQVALKYKIISSGIEVKRNGKEKNMDWNFHK